MKFNNILKVCASAFFAFVCALAAPNGYYVHQPEVQYVPAPQPHVQYVPAPQPQVQYVPVPQPQVQYVPVPQPQIHAEQPPPVRISKIIIKYIIIIYSFQKPTCDWYNIFCHAGQGTNAIVNGVKTFLPS